MPSQNPVRVASVGFVNARPLIHGLGDDAAIDLSLDVPSGLLDRVAGGAADVALLPTIDLQRQPGLRVIPSGGIGCDGETLTVRLFSRMPFGKILTLACDTDSHTSVALSRAVLARIFDARPKQVPLPEATDAEAVLLIGDKVVCEEPAGYPHQLDLGAAWKEMTGLPFVFAVWAARPEVALENLPQKLREAKRRGMADLPAIVERYAVPRGWPAEVAMRYYTEHLRFDIGPRQLEAIRLFHEFAAEDGSIDAPPAALNVVEESANLAAFVPDLMFRSKVRHLAKPATVRWVKTAADATPAAGERLLVDLSGEASVALAKRWIAAGGVAAGYGSHVDAAALRAARAAGLDPVWTRSQLADALPAWANGTI